jgi:hypothetical protein
MIVDLSCDIFSCGTWIFVYALIHVMCLCVYVSMVCQRCMLYDDMYSHDNEDMFLKFFMRMILRKPMLVVKTTVILLSFSLRLNFLSGQLLKTSCWS